MSRKDVEGCIFRQTPFGNLWIVRWRNANRELMYKVFPCIHKGEKVAKERAIKHATMIKESPVIKRVLSCE